jgi:hypothetical protein
MAKFEMELPNDLIKEMEALRKNAPKIFGEMTRAGAEVAYAKASANIKRAFKHSDEILSKLQLTRTYRTPSDDGINTKVAVYGYIKENKQFTRKNTYKKSTGKSYESQGVPVELVVIQREYGNSRGEKKMPIFRPAFNKSKIESAMLSVQDKYIPKG